MKKLNPASSAFTSFQAGRQTVEMFLFMHTKQNAALRVTIYNYCGNFSLFY